MEMRGSRLIGAAPERVWAALIDPEVLRASIPGCEAMEGDVERGFEARVHQRIGPVGASFDGRVELEDVTPGERYRLVCHGKGANAGRARGGADVTLSATPEGATLLDYEVTAHVEGRLAHLGARLLDTFAKKMADRFFENFQRVVEGRPEPEPRRGWLGRVLGGGG
ncbi:CoxG family protein [Amaricoccus solimangrovi]|uniref:Carbon monoxide dehydrogenase subunit G n=1 Tax=Amaricoccus solimangrovi TaxID=2589815 RepID=A0A501WDV3_9RHOB|nr:carbon monoxide dehydrogenase subunit G [Amaricoccus solimangrovi]TPE47578.1 carbon monoxide dehydrogenase subunit G [Amaricoccus solimangrovi]